MSDSANESANRVEKVLGLDKPSRAASRLPWLAWGGLAVVVALAALFWTSQQFAAGAQYVTQPVKKGNLTVTVAATGTLQPTNQVDVGSEISGTIKSVEVDYNGQVARGQVLARIDTTRLEAQVRQSAAATAAARARVLQTQATVAEAKAKLARFVQVQEASGGKVPSRTEMDAAAATLGRAVADEASARAAVDQAEAVTEAQRIDLSKAEIRSPIKGVVLKRAAEPGQTVAAAFQTPVLFSLAEDLTQMELHVDVDEADVGKVKQGQVAAFTVDAYPDRSFPARITQVRFGSKTVAGVVTYETVLKVDNTSLLLRPGMTGTANITVQKAEDVLLVPNAGLRFNPPAPPPSKPAGQGLMSNVFRGPPGAAARPPVSAEDRLPHVWVLREGKPEKVMLKTGVNDGVMTEVTGGELKPGTEVVVDIVEAKR